MAVAGERNTGACGELLDRVLAESDVREDTHNVATINRDAGRAAASRRDPGCADSAVSCVLTVARRWRWFPVSLRRAPGAAPRCRRPMGGELAGRVARCPGPRLTAGRRRWSTGDGGVAGAPSEPPPIREARPGPMPAALSGSRRFRRRRSVIATHAPLEGRDQRRLDPTHRKILPPSLRRRAESERVIRRTGDQVARRPLDFYDAVARRLAGQGGAR